MKGLQISAPKLIIMELEHYQIVLAIGAVALIIFFSNPILLFLLSFVQFFLDSLDGTLYLLLLSLATAALAIVTVIYFINRHKIQRLSITDFLPEDEYERKKREWTQEEMAKLESNPRYQQIKRQLEERSNQKTLGILSEESVEEAD